MPPSPPPPTSTSPSPQASTPTQPTPTDPSQPPTPSTPEISKEAKKTASLQAKVAVLEAQIASTESQIGEIRGQLKAPDASVTVRQHIALLHTYNEIRDVGQGLLGMVAENRGVRIRDVYEEFGVGEGD